jgi:hypothetical protein
MNKVEEFISFLISSTLSGELMWIDEGDCCYIPDPLYPNLTAVRLIGVYDIEIYENGEKLYIEPEIRKKCARSGKLRDLYLTIKQDQHKKTNISKVIGSLYNPLCNLLSCLMIYAVKKEKGKRLGDRIDSLILLLGR